MQSLPGLLHNYVYSKLAMTNDIHECDLQKGLDFDIRTWFVCLMCHVNGVMHSIIFCITLAPLAHPQRVLHKEAHKLIMYVFLLELEYT